MKSIELNIPGKPVAKARPRFTGKTKQHKRAYNKQKKEERFFKANVLQKYKGPPLKGPIYIISIFYMPRPKSHFGTGKNKNTLKNNAPIYNTSKPDIDNLEKFVFDCLNGIAWKDDSQIVNAQSKKIYLDDPRQEPGTKISIYELKNEQV